MKNIHPLAIIEDGASIANDVEIGAYTFISQKSVLKKGVVVMQGAQVHGDTIVGKYSRIYPYAVIGTPPQSSAYGLEDDVKVIIGKKCKIREFVTINAGTRQGRGVTRIGDDCYIMTYCHIAHDCQIGDNVTMANNATLAGHVEVGGFTVIGGLTPVHQFVKIGEGCMIAGASAINQDIPPFCIAKGNRAIVRCLNIVGLKKRFENHDIKSLKNAFRKLFRSGRAIKDVASEILENEKNEKVLQLCTFIVENTREIQYKRRANR